jgi:homopolymeric O-antigen transport system ATP-binding protein
MIAVEARNLTKIYRIYQSPVQRLKEICFRKSYHSDFVALRDINFSVPTGGTFGIIGENGAGKSTLLKILANTLKPTSGDLSINGRTAALLELGAGFNPELTGEENIYLNAYLMGLSKGDIDKKRQEIIEFSELGAFMGRPIKTYSSGMQVRLAFSIATSVDPDVLIIDEALSVGDLHFQKKCIDRMTQFRERGKTIVFCSHSLYHVQELCKKTMWLRNGVVRSAGNTGKVLNEYQNYLREKDFAKEDIAESASGPESPVQIQKISLYDADGQEIDSIKTFQPMYLKLVLRCIKGSTRGHVGFALVRNDEEVCFGTATHFDHHGPVSFIDGMEVTIFFPSLTLLNGIYYFRAALADDTGLHAYHTVSSSPFSVQTQRKELGVSYLEHSWEIDGL